MRGPIQRFICTMNGRGLRLRGAGRAVWLLTPLLLLAAACLLPGPTPARSAPAGPAPRLDPPTNTPTATPLCCGSLAVATFTTDCTYNPITTAADIDYHLTLVNNCPNPVAATVTAYLQVASQPSGPWDCWDELPPASYQLPANSTTTLYDDFLDELIPQPPYTYYRVLVRVEQAGTCSVQDFYSDIDIICFNVEKADPDHVNCTIPPPPDPTPTVTCAPSDWCKVYPAVKTTEGQFVK